MGAQHYVSKFHLRMFCDPTSAATPDPWLWLGEIATGSVRRRSPKNVGTLPDFFDGPGGFESPDVTIETFLANEVEGPAARSLREVCDLKGGKISALPAPLMRYLAWAASRNLPIQQLEQKWPSRISKGSDVTPVEPPPEGLAKMHERRRPIRFVHPIHGQRTVNEDQNPDSLLDAGWIPDPTERSNFLEGIHIQAYYFQARWFPRLHWFTLRPPTNQYFIIGDRPVGWGVSDSLDAPPCCLRDPSAFLIAPLSHSLALVGRNDDEPWAVSPQQINAVLAAWSYEWVAGPTADCVADAIRERQRASIQTAATNPSSPSSKPN